MDLSSAPYTKSYGAVNAYDNAQLQLGDTYVIADNPVLANYQKFVDSLFFPEIHIREESIEQPSDGTFDWIFDGVDSANDPFDSNQIYPHMTFRDSLARCAEFTQWLRQVPEHASCAFWVIGKAGSGKSTLMSHIAYRKHRHEPSKKLESGPAPVLLKHFFWELGAPLQRSITGCLRALLWQFFESYSERGFAFWQEHLQQRLRRLAAWTSKSLGEIFDLIATRCAADIVIFVDGLDECTDRTQLLQFLRKHQNNSKIKLCVSSRPDRNLELAIGHWPCVKLEDLTERDMREYVRTEVLPTFSAMKSSTLPSFEYTRNLEESLVSKAQGVFVWLVVACKSLLEGIENRDSPDILSRRLEELPCDVLQLYNHMITRHKSSLNRYSESAAYIFNLMLQRIKDPSSSNTIPCTSVSEKSMDASSSSIIPLTWLSWALDDSARTRLLQSSFDYDSVLSICRSIDHEQTYVWVKTHCANLIEAIGKESRVSSADSHCMGPEMVKNFQYKFLQIQFVHKTVGDFLKDTKEGQNLLKVSFMTEKEAQQKILEAALCDTICNFVLVRPDDRIWSWAQLPSAYLSLKSLDCHQWNLIEQTMTRLLPSVDIETWLADALWGSSRKKLVIPSGPWGFLYIWNWLGYHEHVRESVSGLQASNTAMLSHFLFLTVMLNGCRMWDEDACFSFLAENPRVGDSSGYAEHIRFLLRNGVNPNSSLNLASTRLNRWARRLSPVAYYFYLRWIKPQYIDPARSPFSTIQLLLDCGADLEIKLPPTLLEGFLEPMWELYLPSTHTLLVIQKNPLNMIASMKARCKDAQLSCLAQQLQDRLSTYVQSSSQQKIALLHGRTWHLLSAADIPQGTELDGVLHRIKLDGSWLSQDQFGTVYLLLKDVLESDMIEKHRRQVTFSEFLRYFEWEEDDIQAARFEPNFAKWQALFTKHDPDEQ